MVPLAKKKGRKKKKKGGKAMKLKKTNSLTEDEALFVNLHVSLDNLHNLYKIVQNIRRREEVKAIHCHLDYQWFLNNVGKKSPRKSKGIF